MQELVGKYPEDSPSPCLLPVLKYLLKIRTSISIIGMSCPNKPELERDSQTGRYIRSSKHVLCPSFMGKYGQRQEHSDFGNK